MEANVKFQNDVLMFLVNSGFNKEFLSNVKDAISCSMLNYEIQEKKNEVAIYNDDNFKFLELYLITKESEGKSKKTVERYKYVLNKFLCRTIDISILCMNQFHIRKYLIDLEHSSVHKDKLSKTTVNGERRILNRFFTWLEDEEFIKKNPMRKIPNIKGDTFKEPALTEKEVESIIEKSGNQRNRAIITFSKDTACRVSELCGIKMKDIDLKNNSCELLGKGNKKRVVFFSERTTIYINEYLNFLKQKYNIELYDNDYLFISTKTKKRLSQDAVRGMMKKVGNTCKISRLHPHRFRVTQITNLINKGMQLEKVRDFAGHEDINTTLGYFRGNTSSIMNEYKRLYC